MTKSDLLKENAYLKNQFELYANNTKRIESYVCKELLKGFGSLTLEGKIGVVNALANFCNAVGKGTDALLPPYATLFYDGDNQGCQSG